MHNIYGLEYPKAREWDVKVFAMPNIPRGEGFSKSLRLILETLKSGTPYNSVIKIPGSDSSNSLEDLCIRLRPVGILRKNASGWDISNEANAWLESCDNMYLAAILNANIRFFSEILAILNKEPKEIKSIMDMANNEYNLHWKTKSELHARLNWLRDLELVEFQDFSLQYSITELGIEFLDKVGYVSPENLITVVDETINENEIPISDWAIDLCNSTIDERRKQNIGYFPGSATSFHNTVSDYLQLMNNPTEMSTIVGYSEKTFGIKESSTRSFISNLVNLDLIERKTKVLYQTSELGKRFPTPNPELDFACCIHNKYAFVFELLLELKETPMTTKQLAVIAKVSYGFTIESSGEIHKRLNILKNAKLIRDVEKNSFSLTHRGEKFLELLHLNSSHKKVIENKKTIISDEIEVRNSKVDDVLSRIWLTSRDSSNPDYFEEALKDAFNLLGFKANWLGGSGKTDILLQAPTSPKYAYSVAIDAKTTYSGGITEGQVNFDTLNDHRKKHNADFSVIVGRSFEGARLIERAKKHGVALIDVENLETLIKWHLEVPLKFDSYKKIFIQHGIVDLNVINEDRRRIIREGYLLQSILKCLADESSDPITEGILQPREIYHLLKSDEKFTILPTLEEIDSMLQLLSSPLIGCVGKTKEGYFALGSLTDAAKKFEFYLKACNI